jgi:PPM family protein phosphatase
LSEDSEFTYACRASTGTRNYQEDSSEVWRPQVYAGKCQPLLAVVADGMGGHVSGEVASNLTCRRYIEAFSTSDGALAQRLDEALTASNEALECAIRDDAALTGMGCTFVAIYLDSDGLRWVSVGDTALLLYRNGTLRRLNADHSLGAMLNRQVEAGLIPPEAAQNDPRRRALRSALTGGQIPLKDSEFNPYPLGTSDWVILATDGLEVLSGNEIASIVKEQEHSSAEAIAGSLMEAVEKKQAEYQDNTTVIVLQLGRRPFVNDQRNNNVSETDADTERTVIIDARPNEAPPNEKRRKWFPRLISLVVLAMAAIFLVALQILSTSQRHANVRSEQTTIALNISCNTPTRNATAINPRNWTRWRRAPDTFTLATSPLHQARAQS